MPMQRAAAPFNLVVVLKGAFIFAADLVRRITVPCTIDFHSCIKLRLRKNLFRKRHHPAQPYISKAGMFCWLRILSTQDLPYSR